MFGVRGLHLVVVHSFFPRLGIWRAPPPLLKMPDQLPRMPVCVTDDGAQSQNDPNRFNLWCRMYRCPYIGLLLSHSLAADVLLPCCAATGVSSFPPAST